MDDTTDRTRRPDGTGATDISARLTELIRTEIAAADGLLPFDRFMDLALYAPGLGYYVAGAVKLGRDGDFVTAPEISPLFGRCLAAQCAEVLERLGGGDLLELGAGTGTLAVEVLKTLEHRDSLPGRYLILEPSPDLRERQRTLIRERIPHLAERCAWLPRLPETLRGVVLANEVLDAMPVHRFSIREDGGIDEVFVTERAGAFLEVTAPARSPGLADAVGALQAEGFTQAPGYGSEINLRLPPWMKALSGALEAGLVLLVDYGYPRPAYYQPDRTMGTLMCHRRHQAHGDPYSHVGLQDITAHVDFTAAAEAGVAAGFELAGFTTQASFLIGCGIDRILSEAPDAFDLTPGAKQLLLPTIMGERFKVMGLTKEIDGALCGFSIRDLSGRL
ncbi:class I SAM-dependent methyltransferase [Thiocapsa roseopersicina]|uniref:SAM-dependent methyltransferase, MidA family n=1 Tax=Thiocapsa roseopersicina TaxID=1058 RepID=A0A1H3A3D0_THIRO|nr:SAM-dependent methyltransferase [Thiocapsa roseopersicina]SDX23911.1 SAM-dependent methyltransferase, MidA family [Thiocapsa roseopersicina]